jgi:hypothetical protein
MNNIYYCSWCNYSAKQKSHYNKHLISKKHQKLCSATDNVSKMYPNVSTMYPNVSKKVFKCKYCNKEFKYSQGLSKHIKYRCKKNDDEDIKELVRLLNETLDNQKKKDKEIESMKRQINILTKKLQIQKTNNNISNSYNNNKLYNINLLNINNTDISHLTDQDYIKCIKDVNYCVKSLICKVHFDPKKPENHNIYISNLKSNYVMVYKNSQWEIVNRKEKIDDLYDDHHMILEDWYVQYKETYPEIVNSFERYLKNKEDDETVNRVKRLIAELLYNKRGIVEKTRNSILESLIENGTICDENEEIKIL